LVLTLCGILKDILLVMCSMLIWGTQVSLTQFFGYSIALGGLLYYKLGADQLKQHVSQAGRSWAEFGANRPVARKLVIGGLVFTTILILLAGLGPTVAPGQTQSLKDYLSSASLPGR
jgi:hypothetical protein